MSKQLAFFLALLACAMPAAAVEDLKTELERISATTKGPDPARRGAERTALGRSAIAGAGVRVDQAAITQYQTDDGSFENGIRFTVTGAQLAQRFDLVSPSGTIESVEVCFVRLSSASSSIPVTFIFWGRAADGFPGVELHRQTRTVNLPTTSHRCRSFSVASVPFSSSSQQLWVGVQWDALAAGQAFLSVDETLGAVNSIQAVRLESTDPWVLGLLVIDDLEHFGIRVGVDHGGGGGQLPTTDFSFVRSGLRVDFINESVNATSYLWDYGNGIQSPNESPFHTYAAEGTYDVSLTATNSFGSDVVIKSVTVPGDDQPPPDGLDFGPIALVQNGRFRVEAIYTTDQGVTGTAQGAVYEDTSSFWHFFGQKNIELFAKVLDACGLNGHFWVFLAGATNVGVELRVTDTQNGGSVTYTNPPGMTMVTVTDTFAFACVP